MTESDRKHFNFFPKKVIGSLLLLFFCWVIGLSFFVSDIRTLETNPEIDSAEAIVVLTGGSGRVSKGFDLLEEKKAEKLFISGVHQGIEVNELLNLWRDTPENLECCISLGYQAESTSENAKETHNWIIKEGFNSIILVTSNYHMKRALLNFNPKAFQNISILPYAVKPEKLDLSSWWQNPEHRNLMIREYNKYLIAMFYFNFINPLQE